MGNDLRIIIFFLGVLTSIVGYFIKSIIVSISTRQAFIKVINNEQEIFAKQVDHLRQYSSIIKREKRENGFRFKIIVLNEFVLNELNSSMYRKAFLYRLGRLSFKDYLEIMRIINGQNKIVKDCGDNYINFCELFEEQRKEWNQSMKKFHKLKLVNLHNQEYKELYDILLSALGVLQSKQEIAKSDMYEDTINDMAIPIRNYISGKFKNGQMVDEFHLDLLEVLNELIIINKATNSQIVHFSKYLEDTASGIETNIERTNNILRRNRS